MKYDDAIDIFLYKYPETLDNYQFCEELTKEDIASLTEEDIAEAVRDELRTRFYNARREKRRPTYDEIKNTKESIKILVDIFPVASPIERLMDLQIRYQKGSLNFEQTIKLFGAAIREVNILIPRENKPTFSSIVGLPDLIPKQTSPETDKTSSETPKHDTFGGAMMSHANTEQETSGNS